MDGKFNKGYPRVRIPGTEIYAHPGEVEDMIDEIAH